MSTPLLVLTSDIPFGELIRQSLEETGRYVVRVTMEQEAAVAFGRESKPPLAFLDTSLTEKELLNIGGLLRQSNPGIIFVVVSEAGWHSTLEELSPSDYLSKPFTLPDLLQMMDKYLRPSRQTLPGPQTQPAAAQTDVPWLTDVTRAAQHLTRLTLESAAQAALITRNDELWAYAGQLPQSAANELAEAVVHYWDHKEENDLVRFIGLESTDAEHMLYATRLADGMVLALVFDAETPFSTIRNQASQLIHSLASSPAEEQPRVDEQDDPENDGPTLTSAPSPLKILPTALAGRPRSGIERISSQPEAGRPLSPQFSRDHYPALQVTPQIDTAQDENLSAGRGMADPGAATYSSQAPRPELEENEVPNLYPSPDGSHRIVLEPSSPSVYNLNYACVLLPRFPQHHLTGDLLERLGFWMQQICIAFNWRLEYISVRPDYMQWIVNVPPASAPAHLMRTVRQHLSTRIFREFPRFKEENPSGDFWTSADLILGGSQPAPAQLIKDFITQTRQQQGIPPQQYRH